MARVTVCAQLAVFLALALVVGCKSTKKPLPPAPAEPVAATASPASPPAPAYAPATASAPAPAVVAETPVDQAPKAVELPVASPETASEVPEASVPGAAEVAPDAPTAREGVSAEPGAAPGEEPPPRVVYSPQYDDQLKEILNLARKNRWVEAQEKAEALHREAGTDTSVERVYSWVTKQRKLYEARNLEDAIREIDANNAFYNPTIPELLLENKDRGLPPRKDIRDALDQIEATPYVPPTFGRTNRLKGPLFDFASEQGRMQKILDKEITVQLDNAPLETIIFEVGGQYGINFVADKALAAFKQTLSVNLEKVRLREFLNYVSRNLNLQFQVGEDLIWIVDATDAAKRYEETRFYRLRKGFVLPAQFGLAEMEEVKQLNPQNRQVTAITQKQSYNIFVNDDTPDMPSIEMAITNFFTGKYFIDYERNFIVAKSTREELEVLEKLIREFDQPIQQVLIEARFVTVSQPAFMSLGVLWETGRQPTTGRAPRDFTGMINDAIVGGVGLGISQTWTNVLGSDTLTATLTALEQTGESQTLSAPRLTVLNNRPARISDGKVQYYYEEYTTITTITERSAASSFVPQGKPTKLQGGVELDVLASIGGDGKSILMALNPVVNQDVRLVTFATLTDVDSEGNVITTFDIKLPETRTQELATRVVVKSGQTVVMGGVLEREQSTYVEAVPVLGSLPLIGGLFRRRTEVDKPRYLLIFVTATIVAETGEFIIYEEE